MAPYVNNPPAEEWDDQNLLYSLRFDLGCAIIIPGPNNPQRQISVSAPIDRKLAC